VAVAGTTFSPAQMVLGKKASAGVIIENRGTLEAENITVAIYERGTMLASGRLQFLSPRTLGRVTLTWMPGEGAVDYIIVVDPQDTIVESDEDNNRVEQSLPPPKVSPSNDGSGSAPLSDDILYASLELLMLCLVVLPVLRAQSVIGHGTRRW
jgi:subtilase family serine protease